MFVRNNDLDKKQERLD